VTWAQAITATVPPGLEQPALAYDKGRGVVVMFGGYNGTAPATDYRTTYEFDGVDWTLKTPANAPLSGYRGGMVYDDARGRIVFYGASSGGAVQQKTWEYDGNDWTLVGTGGPGRISEGYMAYLPTTQQTLYFGGTGPTLAGTLNNETWVYSGPTNAIAAPFGKGCATSAGIPAFAASTLPVLGTNYDLTLTGAPAGSIAFVVHGLDNLQSSKCAPTWRSSRCRPAARSRTCSRCRTTRRSRASACSRRRSCSTARPRTASAA
jgi:hypothetical protein